MSLSRLLGVERQEVFNFMPRPCFVQAVSDDGTLTWSPITVMKSFRPDLQAASYLRMTTAAGQVTIL
jgi:hypothetical protein